MKKLISFIIGVSLIGSSLPISEMIPERYQALCRISCIVIGAIILSYFVYCLEKSRTETDENKFKGLNEVCNKITDLNVSCLELKESEAENFRAISELMKKLADTESEESEEIGSVLRQICENQSAFGRQMNSNVESIISVEKEVEDAVIKASETKTESIMEKFDLFRRNFSEFRESESNNFKMVSEKLGLSNDKLDAIVSKTADLVESATKVIALSDEIKAGVEIVDNDFKSLDAFTSKLSNSIAGEIIALSENIENSNDALNKKLEDRCYELSDTLLSNYKKISRSVEESADEAEDNISNLTKLLKEREDKISGEIKVLADEYNDFKEYSEALVEKMQAMSETDYKTLKGIFDGKF